MTTIAPTKEDLLARVKLVSKRRNKLKQQFQEADKEMRDAICDAFDGDVPASAMVEPTGLGGARLYQIRDGR